MKNEVPTYNMKVVVQETGLKPDTLRAWERRYGVPNPQRTAGGHRLYSQHEIDLLKWLVARQSEGMSISHAVELWSKLLSDGIDPTEAYGSQPEVAPSTQPISGTQLGQQREAWIEACLAFDEYRAQRILAESFATFPLETVCLELLFQALNTIGHGWFEGKITVQQEHFASSLALRQLEALLAAQDSLIRGDRVLVANPAGEQHTFSSLLISLMLRRRGLDVIYLGANVPMMRMNDLLHQVKPAVVVLSAQTLRTAASLKQMAEFLTNEGVSVLYGGAVFNNIREIGQLIPGYFLGPELQDTPDAVLSFLNSPKPLPKIAANNSATVAVLNSFRKARSEIDGYVQHKLDAPRWNPVHLGHANGDLGDNIEAALNLGDMGYLTTNMAWVRGLLINYHYRMPETLLQAYVECYYRGCQEVLGEKAEMILEWFRDLMGNHDFTYTERGSPVLPAN